VFVRKCELVYEINSVCVSVCVRERERDERERELAGVKKYKDCDNERGKCKQYFLIMLAKTFFL
jgi:hypothetical protein